jgi:hypothetical protein
MFCLRNVFVIIFFSFLSVGKYRLIITLKTVWFIVNFLLLIWTLSRSSAAVILDGWDAMNAQRPGVDLNVMNLLSCVAYAYTLHDMHDGWMDGSKGLPRGACCAGPSSFWVHARNSRRCGWVRRHSPGILISDF